MAPAVRTCRVCATQVRAGLIFCPACAAPVDEHRATAAVATPPRSHDDYYPLTDAWDSVVLRLQAALYGEFVISRELGRGGMAAVFLAHQLKLNRKVAIKVMAPTLMSGLGLVDRFQNEATTVARLDHPNIISIFQVGESAGLQYFIMQYVAGRSLERAIRQYGRLSLEVARAVLFEVGSALAYAHRHQVIHRDVKPGNVLLNLDGRVIVSDFGIAKVAESSARTQTGAVVGTPAYMSPEQCMGRPLTWSADQYALGVVAYEMLTGTQPFVGTPYAVMRGHTEDPVPDILASCPDCPPDVAAAVTRMLGKRPADRFPSMTDALTALGASRMAVDDAAQESIGQLAIPLPDEGGVVIVDTPRSPTPRQPEPEPAQPEPVGPGASTSAQDQSPRRGAAVRAYLVSRGTRVADVGRSASARVRQAGRAVPSFVARSSRAARAASRTMWARLAPSSRRSRVLVASGAAALVTGVLALALVRTSGGVARPDTVRAVVMPVDTSPKAAPPPPSEIPAATNVVDTVLAASVDSLVQLPIEDSLGTAIDSGAARTLAPSPRSATGVTVGESLQFTARVLDYRGNRVRDARPTWSVSREAFATIDTATGLLRALAPGTVMVTVRFATLQKRIPVTVVQRPTQVGTDAGKERPRADTARKNADASADIAPIESAVTAFVSAVLDGRDIQQVRALYRLNTAKDSVGLDALMAAYREKNLEIRPQSVPPQPSIRGSHATSDVEITLRQRRMLGRPRTTLMTAHVILDRGTNGWGVTGFSLSPPINK